MSADSDELPVTVETLSGESADVSISASATVHELKKRMKTEWQVNPIMQTFLFNGVPLEDASTPLVDAVAMYGCEWTVDDPLNLTLIVSLPYGGDLMEATKAHDRPAIRVIMTERDKFKPPMSYQTRMCWNKGLRTRAGWTGIELALVEDGWQLPDVQTAVQDYCKSNETNRSKLTYQNMWTYMRENCAEKRA
eukprot:TRINITY_DN7790_c0_g1_i6.p1 TRINITY_DN7790_c0_g1~~TRINITY_DN7790_c0_g1_i6.p1  ORF type:complete len:193 (+),score=20.07 TRINITY_DN7790_c0_g1_i6:104-682(+)